MGQQRELLEILFGIGFMLNGIKHKFIQKALLKASTGAVSLRQSHRGSPTGATPKKTIEAIMGNLKVKVASDLPEATFIPFLLTSYQALITFITFWKLRSRFSILSR